MLKRLVPLLFVAALAIAPMTQIARPAIVNPPAITATAAEAEAPASAFALTEAERMELRAAEQAAHPDLQHQRGGAHVLLVVALIILLIVIID
jgi:hypothetical protein